jgi:hypothetical protein
MTRPLHRVSRWQRRTLLASGLLLLATGLVWLAVHYSIGAGADRLPHRLEAWSLRLHGLAAFVGLFALGLIAGSHVPQGWRMSARHRFARQRGTGVALCASGALLALTGYLLYYFAPEWLRPGLGWLHAIAGAVMAALLVVHQRHRTGYFHD